MNKLMTATLSTVLLLAPVAVAHADPADDQFLAALSSHGITMTPDQAIPTGHEVCDMHGLPHVGLGISPMTAMLLKIRNELNGQGLSGPQMDQFANDATAAYCPGANM
jgi:hypothetical protein